MSIFDYKKVRILPECVQAKMLHPIEVNALQLVAFQARDSIEQSFEVVFEGCLIKMRHGVRYVHACFVARESDM